MKENTARLILWAVALLVAARLTWMSIQHHLPAFDTATIALFSLYGARVGAENIARGIQAARKSGATR